MHDHYINTHTHGQAHNPKEHTTQNEKMARKDPDSSGNKTKLPLKQTFVQMMPSRTYPGLHLTWLISTSSVFLSIKIGSSLGSILPSWMDIGQSFIGLDSETVESLEGEQQCYIPLFLFEPIPVNA